MKTPLLHSFEKLIRGMDPGGQGEQPTAHDTLQQQPKLGSKPRLVVEDGLCLGRKWRRYSDGSFEGETVAGMESFKDLGQFETFVASSPVVRSGLAVGEVREGQSDPDAAEGEGGESDTIPEQKVLAAPSSGPRAELAGAPAASRGSSPSIQHQSVSPKISPANVALPRDLMLAGALGSLAAFVWWFRFHIAADLHAELARRGIGQTVAEATNLSVIDSLSCLFVNTTPCLAMKHWGRLAGYLVYEPAFLWIALCAFIIGAGLRCIESNRARHRAPAHQPIGV